MQASSPAAAFRRAGLTAAAARLGVAGLSLFAVSAAAGVPASAQYAFTDLHPGPAYRSSEARGIAGGTIGIAATTAPPTYREQAAVWDGAAGLTFLDTAPELHANVQGVSTGAGGVAVTAGFIGPTTYLSSGPDHAARWDGTVLTDLHPAAGFTRTQAWAVSGDAVVGRGAGTATGGDTIHHALRWDGTALTDLHPAAGFLSTHALGVSGSVTVGVGVTVAAGAGHALRWDGTSVTDIHPAGFLNSRAHAVSGDRIAGYAQTDPSGGSLTHALLWIGTTPFDLHPAGYSQSGATGVFGEFTVGYGWRADGGSARALVWKGTELLYDLHDLTGGGAYRQSAALAISEDGTIVGEVGLPDNVIHAAVWRPTTAAAAVPEPGTLALLLSAGALAIAAGLVRRHRTGAK